MANSNVPMFIQTVQTWVLQIVNATGTTITTLLTAGVNGSKIESLSISNTDTAGYSVSIYINDGTTNYLLNTINVIANSGFNSTTTITNALNAPTLTSLPYDSNGNRYLYLKAGYSLKVAVSSAVTTAKFVNVIANGGDF